ncbi:glycosyltransferase family 2 protein [Caballeronia sp. LZ001]|uniref:glycosyltransferase family 2 protein n=1 Tax=Caballeronia sp. LZ001 TaxID=3038553 RepID=UPI00285E371C|nr:glycosyltransferase family 2 protein [Caballeronia sp. LZ001]MDR5803703.1 glycosyltransferase family 2 protein [Caballeronia sp. LZ001]
MSLVSQHPGVSVIIPCFNSAKTLARALESCLSQTDAAQIIVVDDGSQDASAAVAKFYSLKDRRVELVQMPENGGPARARNHGAKVAGHPILAFLDADDEYQPGALATAALYLRNTPRQPAVRFSADFSDFPADLRAFPDFERHADIMSDTVASTLVIQRATFLALGGFPTDEVFRRYGGEDSALSNAIIDIYGCYRLEARKGVRVHYHPGSHVALYFSRAGGAETPFDEHWATTEAIQQFVARARTAMSGTAESTIDQA